MVSVKVTIKRVVNASGYDLGIPILCANPLIEMAIVEKPIAANIPNGRTYRARAWRKESKSELNRKTPTKTVIPRERRIRLNLFP